MYTYLLFLADVLLRVWHLKLVQGPVLIGIATLQLLFVASMLFSFRLQVIGVVIDALTTVVIDIMAKVQHTKIHYI